MSENKINDGITIDCHGRTVLTNDELAEIEKSYEHSAGGIDRTNSGNCRNFTNGNCTNTGDCGRGTNTSCTNDHLCAGGSNSSNCSGIQQQ